EFLSKYGYLQTGSNDPDLVMSDQSDQVISDAIRKFQKFTGLETTGSPDRATLMKMKAPRCGIPDDVSSSGDRNIPYAYNSMGKRWSKDVLKWKLTQTSTKVSEKDQLSAIESALDLWSRVTPLTFQRTQDNPDIEMRFVRGEHGDGPHNSFDGQGRVLAHAYGPGGGVGGDAHFDEDEPWTVGTGEGADLTMVAAHEFGHSLGLGHSSDPEALMAPFYAYSEKPCLKKDDILGIQSLYGPKTRKPRPVVNSTRSLSTITRRVTSIPTTTATTTPKTTVRTTSNRRTNVSLPAFCGVNFRLDAISSGPGGFLYAFGNGSVYKIGAQGLEPGYPKLISQVYHKGPRASVDAATYIPETKKTYLFKDFQVWRYTNFTLDVHYPKIWTDVRTYNLSAAMTLTYEGQSQIIMFGNDNFWAWNPNTEQLVSGYPLPTEIYFPHAPQLPDAAFTNPQGHFIFFKGNSLKQLKQRGTDEIPQALGPNLFGTVCGGDSQVLSQLVPDLSYSRPTQNHGNNNFFKPEFLPSIWSLLGSGVGPVKPAKSYGPARPSQPQLGHEIQ
ncbi:unnamed protein product, partial [Candidula unifasciata]